MLTRVPDDLRERVGRALHEFVSTATPQLDEIGDELRPLTAAATDFVLGGGKRLRPRFCYWAARAVGAPDDESIVRAAASLELLQACALVHDDVIDRSATRRGQPAVHERFAALHRDQAWAGDASAFGAAAAILVGDLFLVWSEAMLAGSGLDAAALARARPISDIMRVELMAGQYLDVVEQVRGGGSVDSALRVARYKAAKYTVERPLHLGAALADGDDEVFAVFSDYGLPLGEAFQLRDDMLGVYGDPAVTGKPAGDDLREGKRTALVAIAMQSATPSGRDVLTKRLGDPDLDDDGVAAIREIVTASGAADHVEAAIAERMRTAVDALTNANLDPSAHDALVELAAAASRRND
jgi:geranylgeranyl diphosphate synthase, type I